MGGPARLTHVPFSISPEGATQLSFAQKELHRLKREARHYPSGNVPSHLRNRIAVLENEVADLQRLSTIRER